MSRVPPQSATSPRPTTVTCSRGARQHRRHCGFGSQLWSAADMVHVCARPVSASGQRLTWWTCGGGGTARRKSSRSANDAASGERVWAGGGSGTEGVVAGAHLVAMGPSVFAAFFCCSMMQSSLFTWRWKSQSGGYKLDTDSARNTLRTQATRVSPCHAPHTDPEHAMLCTALPSANSRCAHTAGSSESSHASPSPQHSARTAALAERAPFAPGRSCHLLLRVGQLASQR